MNSSKGQVLFGFLIGFIIHGTYDSWLVAQPLLLILPPDVGLFGTITGMALMILGGFITLLYLTKRAWKLDSERT